MTDFYQAPDEIRYDKEMSIKVLLDSEEFLWNIPKEMRTPELYEEIFQKGYKHDILSSQYSW